MKSPIHTYCNGTLTLYCTGTYLIFPGIPKLAPSPGHGKNINLLMSICCRLRCCAIMSTFKQRHYTRRAKRQSPAYPNFVLWRDSHVQCTWLSSAVLNSSYIRRQTDARRKETVRYFVTRLGQVATNINWCIYPKQLFWNKIREN
jgi:hypothetical protein